MLRFNMQKPKRVVLLFVVVVAVLAVAFSSFFFLNSQRFPGNLQSVTYGNLPLETSGLIYVAQSQGFFRQNGLNVVVRNYDTGIASTNALLSGQLEIAGGSEYPLVNAAFQNQSIQAIAGVNKSELEYLVDRRDHGIENASDLKGKTIALPWGTIVEYYVAQFLSLSGLKTTDVSFVNMTLSQSENALMNGTIDAVANWQPYTNEIVSALGSNAVAWSVQGSPQSFGVLACRTDWINANPQLVKQFLQALYQAEDFINSNPTQAKAIVKQQMNFTAAYMETVWKQNQFALSLDQSLVLALENEARWMIIVKLTNQTAIPNFLNYLYLNGLLSIKPESVNIIH